MNQEQLAGMEEAAASQAAALHQQQLAQHQLQNLSKFWLDRMGEIQELENFKQHELPLARIKRIMKSDEDVKMISAEAPVLFAKACEIFILELTLRAWMHTEENKRRTLQRNDLAMAITKTDMFDFLIDIVPRDDIKAKRGGPTPEELAHSVISPEMQAQYYYHLAQQHQALQHAAASQQGLDQQQAGLENILYYHQQHRLLQQAQLMQQLQMQQTQHIVGPDGEVHEVDGVGGVVVHPGVVPGMHDPVAEAQLQQLQHAHLMAAAQAQAAAVQQHYAQTELTDEQQLQLQLQHEEQMREQHGYTGHNDHNI